MKQLSLGSCLLIALSFQTTSCGLNSTSQSLVQDASEIAKARDASKLTAQSSNAGAAIATVTTCDGKPVGTTEQRTRYDKSTVSFGELCQPEIQLRVCNSGKWSPWTGQYLSESCVVQKSLDCTGGANGTTETRTRFKESAVSAGGTCASETQTRACSNGQWSSWSGSFSAGVCTVGQPVACGTTNHGASETRVRYKSSSVEFGKTCEGEVQARFCNNGNFDAWSGSYQASSCVVQAPAACTYPTIPHGGIATRIRYENASVPFGSTCESEVQVASCFNGKNSGFSGTFTAEKCAPQLPKSCEIRSSEGTLLKTLSHGGTDSKVVYELAEVAFGEQCKSEILNGTCNNGVLEYSASTFKTPQQKCVVKDAAPCTDSKGAQVASGTTESATKYPLASVKFGETCQAETRSRTCNNGSWTTWTGSATFDACKVADPLACGGVAHGASQTQVMYKSPTVAYGQLCSSEAQTRTCNNGVFSNWSGSFTNASCSALPPLSCGTVAHNQAETRVRYGSDTVPYGSSCQSEVQSRLCTNGTFSDWSGTMTFGTCSVQSAAACANNVASGTTESRTRYLASTAPYGSDCQDEIQTRTCNNGTFSSWSGSLTATSCVVSSPAACGTTSHGGFETRTRYFSTKADINGQCVSEVQSRACSNGTFSEWSGTYKESACEALVPQVKVFDFKGSTETFVIPNHVTSVEVKAWGGGGCVFDETPDYAISHTADYGGAGGFSSAVISVTPGETLTIQVGQGGQKYGTGSAGYPNGGDGYNGGCAGGGSSNVFAGSSAQTLLLVAGGGGGAGWYTPSGAQKQGNGAPGGGLVAQSGPANPGSGGSQTQGGQTGNGKGASMKGGASSGNGGTGGPGGGGGGYFGGASGVGGFGNTNGGGGGGSCFVGTTSAGQPLTSTTTDYIDSAGLVRTVNGRSYSNAQCLSGTVQTPPKQSDVDYVAGLAMGGDKAKVANIPGFGGTAHKFSQGGNGRVVIRYAVPASQVVTAATTPTAAPISCAADEGNVTGLGCLYKDGSRYLIGVIKQNVINPTQVTAVVRPDDLSKVIDDARWMKIWNGADSTTNGNWRLVAQMETSANVWESNVAPPANNVHLMKNANRLPLVKSLSAPVLTAYVYSLFHHEDSGDTWMGVDYSGIIYGGPNGYSTFGWYNQASTNNFFNAPYSYASLRMRLWIYPPANAQ